jgi:hypothetical protein
VDGHGLAAQKVSELNALSWEELDRDKRIEDVTLSNGQRFKVESQAFWDMDAWESDMWLGAKVYATRGWHRYWPHKARALRLGEDLPERPPTVG